eukprot:2826702-Pyramimonas_sp.AAC.3
MIHEQNRLAVLTLELEKASAEEVGSVWNCARFGTALPASRLSELVHHIGNASCTLSSLESNFTVVSTWDALSSEEVVRIRLKRRALTQSARLICSGVAGAVQGYIKQAIGKNKFVQEEKAERRRRIPGTLAGGWSRCKHHDEQLGPGVPRPYWGQLALCGSPPLAPSSD